MTEAEETQQDATPAEKRQWLRANGYTVGARGKLSKEHEDAYAGQRVAGQPENAEL